jgi:NADP-dependent 3-hydroxy acid dehydrogenase YdfG
VTEDGPEPLATSLSGRVGLLTGGGSGIGAAITSELARLGARLVVGELDDERAAALERDATASPGTVEVVRADVRRYEDMVALHDRAIATHGSLDFVVANAGVTDWGSMSEGDPARWREVIDTNLLGVAHTIRAALPTLRSQRGGHVVIVASASGRITYVGEPIYIATKWGVVGLGRALRKEVARDGVRVSLIEPGLVDTSLTRSTSEGRAELEAIEPLRPGDVARMVAHVLSQPRHVAIDELLITPVEQEL